jgi:hypothetical protein
MTDTPPDAAATPEFKQVLCDFTRDLVTTFPELVESGQLRPLVEGPAVGDAAPSMVAEYTDAESAAIFDHVKSVMPPVFFDILYKNDSIFSDDTKNTEFLPNIDFGTLWSDEGVSESIRETLWNYFQLLMFSVLGSLNSEDSFGESAKLFQAINEDELRNKIQESVEHMQQFFEESVAQESGTPGSDGVSEGEGQSAMPDPSQLHDHLSQLLGGKLGKLAHEIAEETTKDFDLDTGEDANVGDVFNKLFRNPGKLMGIVNNISKKLDSKLKSGEYSETELMKEAGDLMSKMKDIPGMPDIQDLMKNMNLSGAQKGLFKQKMASQQRMSSQKERLQRKLEERRAAAAAAAAAAPAASSNGNLLGNTFTDGSLPERSSAAAPPKSKTATANKNKKKKKNNKKK